MNVWKLGNSPKYCTLSPLEKNFYKSYNVFDGSRRLKNNWVTLEVEKMEEDSHLEIGDNPGFIFPVFSRKAFKCLSPLIEEDVEILPITLGAEELSGVNILSVLDVIDYTKSEYVKFPNSEKILAFKKYSFIPSKIVDKHIFKIIDQPRGWTFVSDAFKELVEEKKLEGFVFELVWSEEKLIKELEKSPDEHKNIFEAYNDIGRNNHKDFSILNNIKMNIVLTNFSDYKKVYDTIYLEILEIIKKQAYFSAIGVEGFLDQQIPELYLCFSDEKSPPGMISDWKNEMYKMQIAEDELDETQQCEIILMISKVLIKLTKDGILSEKKIFFRQNQVKVTNKYQDIKNLFEKDTITIY